MYPSILLRTCILVSFVLSLPLSSSATNSNAIQISRILIKARGPSYNNKYLTASPAQPSIVSHWLYAGPTIGHDPSSISLNFTLTPSKFFTSGYNLVINAYNMTLYGDTTGGGAFNFLDEHVMFAPTPQASFAAVLSGNRRDMILVPYGSNGAVDSGDWFGCGMIGNGKGGMLPGIKWVSGNMPGPGKGCQRLDMILVDFKL